MQFTRLLVISSTLLPGSQLAKLIFEMLVSAPAAGAVQQIDCRIPGLCACHLRSLPSYGWILGLCGCHLQFTRSFVKSCASAPATWQLTMPIFKTLESAPATVGVQGIGCQIPGLCACHPCSLRDCLSKLLTSAPATLQLIRLIAENDGAGACHRWSSRD